jgi:hypothetical protein
MAASLGGDAPAYRRPAPPPHPCRPPRRSAAEPAPNGQSRAKLPPPLQGKAKQDLHTIYEAENRRAANDAFDHFIAKYGARYDKAVTCLVKDREVLLTFYDFPAEH